MKLKGYLHLCLVGAGLILASCATAPATDERVGEDGSENAMAQDSGSPDARAAGDVLPSFRPDPASAAVTTMRWGQGESLQLGYADGKWAAIDARRRSA